MIRRTFPKILECEEKYHHHEFNLLTKNGELGKEETRAKSTKHAVVLILLGLFSNT